MPITEMSILTAKNIGIGFNQRNRFAEKTKKKSSSELNILKIIKFL